MQTSLRGIAKKAAEQQEHRFGNLYEMLNEENLLECWRYIKKDAAYGVDRVSAREYEADLEGNIRRLVERLKSGDYRAKLKRLGRVLAHLKIKGQSDGLIYFNLECSPRVVVRRAVNSGGGGHV